ncbi:MAG: DUF5678 domain-containing protein [Candidatus Omnitrophota bacterium]
MIQTLINSNNYDGRYVALKSFKDHTVVGDGDTPKEAHDKAVGKGIKAPVITFIPLKDMVQIY